MLGTSLKWQAALSSASTIVVGHLQSSGPYDIQILTIRYRRHNQGTTCTTWHKRVYIKQLGKIYAIYAERLTLFQKDHRSSSSHRRVRVLVRVVD